MIWFMQFSCHISRSDNEDFQEFFNDFMQALLDNFNVYGNKGDHMYQLQKCL
jgi:hypothetical protein